MSTAHPWLADTLLIRRDVLAAIDADAVREYPNESCGFLLGPAADSALIDEAKRAPNMADKYHRADPETYPRTAATFFIIDARLIYTTFEQGEACGRPVKVIYHSHCDVGAYFSAEDQAAAAPDGVLSYPVAYLVTSVRKDGVDDHKIFTYQRGTWVELPFRVVE